MRDHAPSFRDLRRERLVGNWGGASEQIGRRWEEVGLGALRAHVESNGAWPGNHRQPEKLLPLADNTSLQTALSRSGLPSPDIIVVLRQDGVGRALQALDFKWNLEFASYGQIRAEAIRALLHRGVEPLRRLLRQEVGEQAEDLPVMDGLLFAPNLPVNRWFLQSEANARQEYPIESHEVIFQEVDPLRFFEPLPGWELAVRLARLDRAEARLQTLEGSEHYYRLGAGLSGAVAQLLVSVFVRQPPPVSADAAFEWLRSRVRPPGSLAFVQYVERLMATRAQLHGRLRSLAQSPYRFSDLADALKARNLLLPEKPDGLPTADRERWSEVLRRVASEHREMVYRLGLQLVQSGLSDAEALARLESDSRRFASQARARADRIIDATLRAGS